MHRGRRKLLRSVLFFFYGDGPREMQLYQKNEKYKVVILMEMFNYLQEMNSALGS